jgi:hypothetical protein
MVRWTYAAGPARPPAIITMMVRIRLALVTAVTLALAGCGGSGPSSAPTSSTAARALPRVPGAIPTPDPTHRPASRQAVAVIRGWSQALRAGHVDAAARYFQLPSELINGGAPGGTLALIRIHTLLQAEAANETLPCGAEFISADQRGQYVNALFKLTGRPGPGGGSCAGGSGQTARTNFVISSGHIVEWIRAPDDPGDNPTPDGGGGSGGGGGSTTSSGNAPVV